MDVQCVVFDIDDTLYLERDYVKSGFLAVDTLLRERRLVGFFDHAWQAFQSGLRRTIFDETLLAMGHSADPMLIAQMVEAYREHVPGLSLLPDAAACLNQLHGHIALAAITDGPLASQRAKAQSLGLAKWCRPIVFTEELGPGLGKPHMAAFELVEKETGCRAGQCAYVADNPTKDFHAPIRLGWRTVRVRRPGGLHENVESEERAEIELPDLITLAQVLNIEV
jgi:putative hydrolase of the HAD superfamily